MRIHKMRFLIVSIAIGTVIILNGAVKVFGQPEQEKPELYNPITVDYLNKHLKKKSPKLILTPALEKQLKKKIKKDEMVGRYYQYLVRESKEIMKKPVIKRELQGFRMLAVSREMAERMGVLCMVYRIDKDPEILDRINAELQSVSNFPDWNPQHFLDVGEMSFAVALGIDWAGEWLPASTVREAKIALVEKGLKPSFELRNGRPYWWINNYNNWNAVCHGGMVAAALMGFDVDPELSAKTLHRALENLPNSLKEYAPNGAYPEGPSYWGYGTSYTVLASSMLETALGQDFGIYESEGFKKGPDFYLQSVAPSGEYFNYCDSDGSINSGMAILLTWFGSKSGDGKYLKEEFFEDPSGFGRLAGPGIVWLSNYEISKKGNIATSWYGKGRNPVAYFRNKDDKKGYFLGAKGGVASVIHGNMDVGTFVFELHGVRWVIDPGNQSYYPLNKIGFDLASRCQECARWTLLTKNNKGHSTITVNDERHYADGYAPLVDFKEEGEPGVTFDMTEVAGGNIESHRRKFIKDSDHSMIVEDEIVINDSTKNITWGMMTVADVEMTDNGAILRQDGKSLQMEILSPDILRISVISLDPPPLKIDKTIPGLKRIEIRIPAWTVENRRCNIKVRLSGEPLIVEERSIRVQTGSSWLSGK